jgi:DNA polymerase elongation subunit (family B)
MSNYSNPLIFGKDTTENIVSVEVRDSQLNLFIQGKDGKVRREIRDNTFWLLLDKPYVKRAVKLEGEQHYKYMVDFKDHEFWMKAKSECKRRGWDYYTINESKEHTLTYNGITYFKGMKPKDVSVLFFDIEGTGLTHTKDSRVLAITNVYRAPNGELTKVNFFLDDYNDNQADMLMDWFDFVQEVDPSILAVHNGFGYDLPYIQHVCEMEEIEFEIGRERSPLQFASYTSEFRKDGSQTYEYRTCWAYGREILDTFFLSVKYDLGRTFPSYGLKAIVKHLGLEKPGRSFVDASKIGEYYKNRKANPEMWDKVKKYAEEDAEDLIKIYDLMIPSYFYFAQQVSKSIQQIINGATGSAINNMMVRSYLQVSHSVAKADERISYPGAISFGLPGLYRNVFKADIVSMYPSIIRNYRIYSEKKDPKANFLQIVEILTKERIKNKNLAKETGDAYYKDLQESMKLTINSCYGALGAGGLNYNYSEGAAKITEYGRKILNDAVLYATGKLATDWIPKEDEPEELDE